MTVGVTDSRSSSEIGTGWPKCYQGLVLGRGKLVCEQIAESGELNLRHDLRVKMHLQPRDSMKNNKLFLENFEGYVLYYRGNKPTFPHSYRL